MSNKDTLPPLPDPDHALDCGGQLFYRPDQMRDYARTALSERPVLPREHRRSLVESALADEGFWPSERTLHWLIDAVERAHGITGGARS